MSLGRNWFNADRPRRLLRPAEAGSTRLDVDTPIRLAAIFNRVALGDSAPKVQIDPQISAKCTAIPLNGAARVAAGCHCPERSAELTTLMDGNCSQRIE
jgi:hypothetical protein